MLALGLGLHLCHLGVTLPHGDCRIGESKHIKTTKRKLRLGAHLSWGIVCEAGYS